MADPIRFGAGSAAAVMLALLMVVGVSWAVALYNGDRTARFLRTHPFITTTVVDQHPPAAEDGPATSLVPDLLALASDGASRAHDLLGAVEAAPQLEATDVQRLVRAMRSVLEELVVLPLIRREHAAASRRAEPGLRAFLERHRLDGHAARAKYVLSADAMLDAVRRGDDPLAAGMDAVDAGYERIATGGLPALRAFIATYRTNAYAIGRGYVGRVLAMQHEESRASALQESAIRRRQHSVAWDLQ